MIVVTGAAGFIGSCLASSLIQAGNENVVAVDDFGRLDKNMNLLSKKVHKYIHRNDFPAWLTDHAKDVDAIYHLGARTDTMSSDWEVFERLNLEFSKAIWNICAKEDIPLVYASSAATYGGGEHGFDDDESKIPSLVPLNHYAISKQQFDLWILENEDRPSHWYGLKFFNVFGPNEYHKGRMASTVWHAWNQVTDKGSFSLFRSHNSDYKDGYQQRDFIYVKDIVDVCTFFINDRPSSGIYNVGSGKANTFMTLAKSLFKHANLKENIGFIDTPISIRDKYQYFTQAEITKLRNAGYQKPFWDLDSAIGDYVSNYLNKDDRPEYF
jgi:ADP-L-glycero-D-manno-heptose 6-epimerase